MMTKRSLDTLLDDLAKPKVAPIPEAATSAEAFDILFPPRPAVPIELPPVVDVMPTYVGRGQVADAKILTLDPRPELPGELAWRMLFYALWMIDGHDPYGLYGKMHGLRCIDAVGLEPAAKGMKLVIGGGEDAAQEWATERARILADPTMAQNLDRVLKNL